MDWAAGAGALVDGPGGGRLEAAALRARVRERADALHREGAAEGARVVLTHGSSAALFVDLLALWRLGACAVPLGPLATGEELARVVRHCGARLVLAPDGARRTDGAAAGAPGQALVLYTSGTTGAPKGVVHTFAGLAARFAALSASVDAAGWERALCVLPTSFGHGLVCNSLWPWLGGRELVLFPGNDLGVVARLGEWIDRYRPDFASTVPSIWRWLLHAGAEPPRGGSLRRVHCASAALDGALWERAEAWLGGAPLVNVYGTTETAGWIAGTLPGERPDDGLVGRGWGCEFEIRETVGGAGEIWARAPFVMQGYLDAPQPTAERLRDGWYRTGDLGFLDAQGRLHLRGRADDVVNKAGLKVHPDEVEQVLRACPGVVDACVFGEPHPIFGEEVAAAVVLRGIGAGEARAWCEARLSAWKVPRVWHELESIPRGASGKTSRRRLAESLRR